MPSDLGLTEFAPVPTRCLKEFSTEGVVELIHSSGFQFLRIDDCDVVTFIKRHFDGRYTDGVCALGRCKILIIPLHE